MALFTHRKWNGKDHYAIEFGEKIKPVRASEGETAIAISDDQARMGIDTLVQFVEAGVLK